MSSSSPPPLSSYPSFTPPTVITPFVSCKPRRHLHPINPPIPLTSTLPPPPPNIPTATWQQLFETTPIFTDNAWTVTTHIIPSASPRHPHRITTSFPAKQRATPEMIDEIADYNYRNDIDQGVPDDPILVEEKEETRLWNVLKVYRRGVKSLSGNTKENEGKGLNVPTLFMMPGTSFPKEEWEPALERLVTLLPHIEEIWSMDPVNGGYSTLLNEDRLGENFEYTDASRDILNFLLHYLPSPSTTPEAGYLPPIDTSLTVQRKQKGITDRTLFSVAHSAGCVYLVRAAQEWPQLLPSLILVESTLTMFWQPKPMLTRYLALLTLKRKERWANREEARAYLSKMVPYTKWSKESFEIYMRHGLMDLPEEGGGGGVRLRTTLFQEAMTYLDPWTSHEATELLAEDTNPPFEVFWIMSGLDLKTTGAGGDKATNEVIFRNERLSRNVRLKGRNHWIPQEAPEELANVLAVYLGEKLGVDLVGGGDVDEKGKAGNGGGGGGDKSRL